MANTSKTKKLLISAIVPCFNEAMWVAEGIKGLLTCPLVDEIIAVNDGSTDKTPEILNRFKNQIKIISYQKNRGKGYALTAGLKKAQGEIVVFMDAHHLNVKNSHIRALSEPLIKNQADVVLATTEEPPPDICWRFTGFRAYRKKDLLPFLKKLKETRFGVEIHLNELFKGKRRKIIKPKGLVHLGKHQKMPLSQIPSASVNQLMEMAYALMQTKGMPPQKIKQALDPQKIKSLKALQKAIEKIKDRDLFNYLKKYLLVYLKE
jgi:hypothetical protein